MEQQTRENYGALKAGSEELVARLVEENMGWAEAIARSVARAWNLDWQLDGLDGGAYEALLFCARRFDPTLGVPFRAYARKRIHESSTDEARKSKAWQRAVGANASPEQEARELSYKLLELFPELRDGQMPSGEEGQDDLRGAIRQLLSSAAVVAAFQESGIDNPESAVDYKQVLEALAACEPVHQQIIWGIYWSGQSMRSLAEDWGTDELTVIREHREILSFLGQCLSTSRSKAVKRLKIRPSLRAVAMQMKKKKSESPFSGFTPRLTTAALLLLTAIRVAAVLKIFEQSLS